MTIQLTADEQAFREQLNQRANEIAFQLGELELSRIQIAKQKDALLDQFEEVLKDTDYLQAGIKERLQQESGIVSTNIPQSNR